MFTKALVRTPCKNFEHGLTTANLGKPDYDLALRQHEAYIEAMKDCGLQVEILEADEAYPDSVFVEDTAVLTPRCAIITNPGAPSRRGETNEMCDILENHYSIIETISSSGTLDGGDIMKAGDHFYIGLSERTNHKGAEQLRDILSKYGYTSSCIKLKNMLHLKSGAAYLENNNLLTAEAFTNEKEFQKFNLITVARGEGYAANALWINGRVLIAKGHPAILAKIQAAGYRTIELDVSEFRKLDGGLSCLSLRF